MNVGIIAAVIFFLVVMALQAVEQRRSASAYRKALADSKGNWNEFLEQQRESNRLLALIAQKLDAQQK